MYLELIGCYGKEVVVERMMNNWSAVAQPQGSTALSDSALTTRPPAIPKRAKKNNDNCPQKNLLAKIAQRFPLSIVY